MCCLSCTKGRKNKLGGMEKLHFLQVVQFTCMFMVKICQQEQN